MRQREPVGVRVETSQLQRHATNASVPAFLRSCEQAQFLREPTEITLLHPKYRPGEGVGEYCALSGLPIAGGAVRVTDVITKDFGNIATLLKAPSSPWLSHEAALLLAAPKRWHRSFVALEQGEERYLFWPTMALDSKNPRQARPLWREMLLSLAERFVGATCAIVYKDEAKSRVWPLVRIGEVGSRTPLYLSDSELGLAGTVVVDIEETRRLLLEIESLLDRGFGKGALLHGLPADGPLGLHELMELERYLAQRREQPAFLLAWRASHTREQRMQREGEIT